MRSTGSFWGNQSYAIVSFGDSSLCLISNLLGSELQNELFHPWLWLWRYAFLVLLLFRHNWEHRHRNSTLRESRLLSKSTYHPSIHTLDHLSWTDEVQLNLWPLMISRFPSWQLIQLLYLKLSKHVFWLTWYRLNPQYILVRRRRKLTLYYTFLAYHQV